MSSISVIRFLMAAVLVVSASGFRFPIRSLSPELIAEHLPANVSIPGLDINSTRTTTMVPTTGLGDDEATTTDEQAIKSPSDATAEELEDISPLEEVEGNYVQHGPLISKRSMGSTPGCQCKRSSVSFPAPSAEQQVSVASTELTARSLVIAAGKSVLKVFKGVAKLFLKPIKMVVKLGLKIWKLFGGGKFGKWAGPYLHQTVSQLPMANQIGGFVRQNPAIVSSISQLLEF